MKKNKLGKMENSGDFVEKMMELGIGLTMVRQMPAMMNGVMTPQTVTPPPTPVGCYIAVNGKQAGPFNDDELQRMVQGGIVTNDTLVWKQGMPQWRKASEVPEINKILLMNNIKTP